MLKTDVFAWLTANCVSVNLTVESAEPYCP